MSKSLLIISRQAPWSGPGAREALDIALAGGAPEPERTVRALMDNRAWMLDNGIEPIPPSRHRGLLEEALAGGFAGRDVHDDFLAGHLESLANLGDVAWQDRGHTARSHGQTEVGAGERLLR